MKNTNLKILLVVIILSAFSTLYGQLSFINKISDAEDGIYGISGIEGITMSIDKKYIYTTSQYSMSVFSYDTISRNLTFIKSYRDGDNGFDGFFGASCIIISKDNKNAYIASQGDNSITVCDRDVNTGLLTLKRILYDQAILLGAHAMVLSDDNRFLYVTAWNSNAITVYSRDSISGDITWLQSTHATGCTWPQNIKLSIDNGFVYVSSHTDDAIFVFQRNESTGLLSQVQTVKNGVNGVQGIWNIQVMDVTHDNKFLYAAGRTSVAVFSRNISTGNLTYVTSYNNDTVGVYGINGNYSITIPPDDKAVYTVSNIDSSLTTFIRDTITGQLTYLNSLLINTEWIGDGVYSTTSMISTNNDLNVTSYWNHSLKSYFRNPVTSELSFHTSYFTGMGSTVDGLSGANNSAVSYDNKSVYVSTPYDGLSIFSLNDTIGKLKFKGTIKENEIINGLTGANSILVTPDDKYVYIASQVDDAIVTFQRDPLNNSLNYIQTIYDNQNGVNGLNGATSIIMSPDSAYIYVGSTNDFGIAAFRYDSSNGSLSFLQHINLGTILNFTIDIEHIKISSDGNYIFASSQGYNALYMFKRNISSGILTYLGRYDNLLIGDEYIYRIKSFDISPDSKNIYILYNEFDYILNFSIDNITDSLYLIEALNSDINQIETTRNPDNISVSKDNRFVYVTSLDSSVVNMFQRNLNSGELSFIKAFHEHQNNSDGFDGVTSIVYSRNNKNIFFTSNVEAGISAYRICAYLGNDINICMGDTVALSPGNDYASYNWSTGESISRIKVTSEGLYSVTVMDEYGTIESDTIYVHFYSLPVFSLGSDTVICTNMQQTLTLGQTGFSNYLWSTGEITPQITIDCSSFLSDSIIIWEKVTNNNNCSTTDTIIIYLDSLVSVTNHSSSNTLFISPIPFNEYLEIKSNKILKHIWIYNITGVIIYSSQINKEKININTEFLNNGIYILEIETSESRIFKKILKL